MSPRVLLFDLDGTLTDPRVGIVRCLRYALDRLARTCPSDEVLATFIGPPLRRTFAGLLETSDPELIERAMAYYRERFAGTGLYENRVYEGVPGMLDEARRAASAAFVVTSKPAVYASRILDHFGLASRFDGVHGPDLDGRLEEKADLLAHLLASERIQAADAVMIGDREGDVNAARASGVRSIGVLWGYGSAEELTGAGADALCPAPGALASCASGLAERGR